MKELIQPLYALLIDINPEMRQAILDGTKKITIREGYKNYPVGAKVMLCCHLEPWAVMADIISVRHINHLRQVTEEEWLLDGFESQALMWSGLRKFYPSITMSSPVTVIRWDNVSGTLVEKAERIKALKQHYPQDCQCQDFERWLVANDCHVHNKFPRHFIGDDNLDCDCHIWKKTKVACDHCRESATWVRRTQFSGEHFFCGTCAVKEKNFGKEDPGYFYWEKLK